MTDYTSDICLNCKQEFTFEEILSFFDARIKVSHTSEMTNQLNTKKCQSLPLLTNEARSKRRKHSDFSSLLDGVKKIANEDNLNPEYIQNLTITAENIRNQGTRSTTQEARANTLNQESESLCHRIKRVLIYIKDCVVSAVKAVWNCLKRLFNSILAILTDTFNISQKYATVIRDDLFALMQV